MTHRRRPTLKVGDVCRVAKKYRNRGNQKTSYVVLKVGGDGSQKHTRLEVAASRPSSYGLGRGGFYKPDKVRVRRDYLWFTGHNINDGKPSHKNRGGQWETEGFTIRGNINHAVVNPKPQKGPHKCHCDEVTFSRHGCVCNGL